MYCGANVIATIKTKSNNVVTLFHYGVEINNIQCIRILENFVADFNVRHSNNETLLHWAATIGARLDVVGAKPSSTSGLSWMCEKS